MKKTMATNKKLQKLKTTGYSNLNNEQIMFLYLLNKGYYDHYVGIIERGGLLRSVSNPFGKSVEVFDRLPPDKLEEMKKDPMYTAVRQVNEKLEPLVDIIKSSMEDEYEQIRVMVNEKHGYT